MNEKREPKKQNAVLFIQQAGGDLKNKEKHFYVSKKIKKNTSMFRTKKF